MTPNDLQSAPGQAVFLFNWHIEVIHGPKSNCSPDLFARQGIIEQLESIHFDSDIRQITQAVTFRARIAVDALVLAAPVQVHVVLQAKPGIWLFYVIEDGLGCDLSDHRSYGNPSFTGKVTRFLYKYAEFQLLNTPRVNLGDFVKHCLGAISDTYHTGSCVGAQNQ